MLMNNFELAHKSRLDGKMRIVSLAPSHTEILFKLGMQDSLVGVTDRCNYPAEAKNIECIGSFGKPNVEQLLALKPDLVVAADFENNEIPELLKASGIDVLCKEIRSFEQMFETFRQIGRATAKLPQAEKIIETMQADLEKITEKFKELDLSHRPKVFVEVWHDPITTTGRASFIDEVVTYAGGINVAGELEQGYPHINGEKVIQWDPDVIIICYMTMVNFSKSQLAERIGWADISAVKNGRIIEDIPADLILKPGPRLIEGVKMLAERLHAEKAEIELKESHNVQ